MSRMKIALAQLKTSGSLDNNQGKALSAIDAAADEGARLGVPGTVT